NALRDEVFAINKGNGWHEEKRSYGELIALVHSEVSEALEDYRNGKAVNKVWYEYKNQDGSIDNVSGFIRNGVLGKPCGIPSELADIVIRILDICGLHTWDIEDYMDTKGSISFSLKDLSFVELLTEIHSYLSYSYQELGYYRILALCHAIQTVDYICNQNNINLEEIIRVKLEHNKTRGYKHGGKVI